MASQAEVELLISTDEALPQLERELTAIVRAAEASTDPVELEALLDTDRTLDRLLDELDVVIAGAERANDTIALEAALDSARTLAELRDDLDDVIDAAERHAEQIQIDAELDADLAELDAEIAALVRELEAGAGDVDIEVNVDRDGRGRAALEGVGRGLLGLAANTGKAVGGLFALGVAASSAAPLLAGVATSLESIAPAAALAVSGMITVGLVAGTVKLAMNGVGEAVKNAFDPDVKPEKLAESMKNLAPNARAFVTELSGMRKSLKSLQQTVQNNFFKGLAGELKGLGKDALPVVANALKDTSKELNLMAVGASRAARDLAKDGTLGKALGSSNKALAQLGNIPGQIVKGLGQIGAAAGPSLERLATAGGAAADRVSKKLEEAFKTGRLEAAISGAVDTLKQLGRIGSNVFGGLGNIIKTVNAESGGLFGTLEKVTAAFEKVTASKGFQDALSALSRTMSVLVDRLLPLITTALEALGPVFQKLESPVQLLIIHLGSGLMKVLNALAPVLVKAADAFGKLVNLVTPFIEVAGTLIAAILPALGPLFDALGQTFDALLPVVEQLVKQMEESLVPIFETLATEVLPQILPPLVELSTALLPVILKLMVGLAPSITKLAEAFAKLLVELTPLIVAFIEMTIEIGEKLAPVIGPLIELIIRLIDGALTLLTGFINGFVIPALRTLVALLSGDFSGAWKIASAAVGSAADKMAAAIEEAKAQIWADLVGIKNAAVEQLRAAKDGALNQMRSLRDGLFQIAGTFGNVIRAGLGPLGDLLVDAGRDAVNGLINGLRSRLGALRDIAHSIAETVEDVVKLGLGIHSPSRVMAEVGRDTVEGFQVGIQNAIPGLTEDLQGFAALAPSFAMAGGDTLGMGNTTVAAPNVQVFLGNELLNRHVDSRIILSNVNRDRLSNQGVRR